jgi:hypothetical protein
VTEVVLIFYVYMHMLCCKGFVKTIHPLLNKVIASSFMAKQAKQMSSKKQEASRALSSMFLRNINEILSEYTELYPPQNSPLFIRRCEDLRIKMSSFCLCGTYSVTFLVHSECTTTWAGPRDFVYNWRFSK